MALSGCIAHHLVPDHLLLVLWNLRAWVTKKNVPDVGRQIYNFLLLITQEPARLSLNCERSLLGFSYQLKSARCGMDFCV